MKEVEEGDKASFSVESVSEVTNAPETNIDSEEEKPYSDDDRKEAEDMF